MTPGQRHAKKLPVYYTSIPRLKQWTKGGARPVGRNPSITAWHRQGGHKKAYRQLHPGSLGVVQALEYNPFHKGWTSRVFHPDTHKHMYRLAETNASLGQILGKKIRPGHRLALKDIPLGYLIHDLNGTYIRGAGTCGQVVQKTPTKVQVKLPSGTYSVFPSDWEASIGTISGEQHRQTQLGKAGRNRWLGRRPVVRGVAMNPVDHPHGGGEGKTSGGRPSVTPWGKPAKGQPTRIRK